MAAGYLRRAGSGRLVDGRRVTWSIAEGGRGRRWRWNVTAGDGTLQHVGLIELDGRGRFARLEFETAGAMLTFHPADDGRTAHGNVVRADGVDPIAVPWTPQSAIRIIGDPFASALLAADEPGVVIDSDLAIGGGDRTVDGSVPSLDGRGIPRLIDAREWPLEV